MYQFITKGNFRDEFRNMNRGNQFSHEGLGALYDYLEEMEESTGESIELDVIELCCDFTEYEDLDEFWGDYDMDEYPDMETLEDNTVVIPVGSVGFIIQAF